MQLATETSLGTYLFYMLFAYRFYWKSIWFISQWEQLVGAFYTYYVIFIQFNAKPFLTATNNWL